MPVFRYKAVDTAGDVATGELEAANEAEIVEQMGLARFSSEKEITLYQPKGCPQCAQTGYTGRVSIMEMLPVTDPLRSLVMKHATAADLKSEAVRGGMLTMYEDGLRKAVRGITTFEEVLRVTRES